ncbi:MAG: hypothetical protein JOZ81_20100 [Chloroflexi bacterium]|nr:hypothetical protein [Chloroflexota bacterium]
MRLEEERPRLRPLKVGPADLALRVPVTVGPTAEVIHESHPYSMPPEAIGIPGTLYLYRDRVRIVAGRFAVMHERKFKSGDGSILPEHRAQHVAAVSGTRAKRYLQREHLLKLGPDALAYLTELTHRGDAPVAVEIESAAPPAGRAIRLVGKPRRKPQRREPPCRSLAQSTPSTKPRSPRPATCRSSIC